MVVRDGCCDREMRCDFVSSAGTTWMRRLRSEVEPVRIGGRLWYGSVEGTQNCRCV